jgi:amidase
MFFQSAIKRAEELDEYIEENGKPMGPLHGLPVSCKVSHLASSTVNQHLTRIQQDTFRLKGLHATAGYVLNLKEPAAETNSALVDMLLDAGAVLYAKTNLPQTMMVTPLTPSPPSRIPPLTPLKNRQPIPKTTSSAAP